MFIEKCRADGVDVPEIHLISVIESRAVSNALAESLGVAHKSPQLLLVDHSRAVWHTSHFDINAESIEKALAADARK